MSYLGIHLFAKTLENLQFTRDKLLSMGTEAQPMDKQDIQLSNLCEEMKDAIKKKFCKLTAEKVDA